MGRGFPNIEVSEEALFVESENLAIRLASAWDRLADCLLSAAIRNVFVGVGFVRPVYKKRMMSDQDPAPVFPGVPELLFEPIVLLPALPGVSRFYDRRIQADHATPFLTENETIAAVPADKILHRFGRGFVPYVAGARQQINRDFRIDPAAQLPEPGQLGGVPAVVHQVPGNHHECGLQPVDRVDKLLELLFSRSVSFFIIYRLI